MILNKCKRMSRIYIKTLGGIQIEREGKIIQNLPNQPVRCALFLYLAIKRKATRDELTTLIWPERNDEKTRHSLSQTLYELRKQLGDGFFHATNEYLSISDNVEVDILEFNKFAGAGHNKKAFDLYNGIFLQGYHLNVSKDFESWIERQRFELERRFRDVCRELSKEHLETGDHKAALEIARKWVDTNPLEDEAQHLFIELLAKTGQRAEAIQQYNTYSELISRELDVEPLDATRALIRQIREVSGSDPETEKPQAAGTSGILKKTVPDETEARFVSEEALKAGSPGQTTIFRIHRGWAATILISIILAGTFLWNHGTGEVSELDHREIISEPDGIAVLPFVNMSADPEQEYFADGITEDLLTSLTKLQRMRVISRTSIMRYKNSNLSLPEIAEELNVAYILEGSVRRDQDRVRITAQLIEVENDNHLWADTYDQELTDIFQVKSDIAHQISEALKQQLLPADLARISEGGTQNLSAYDLLLRGRKYLYRPGVADERKYNVAIDFFRQALAADPDYARSYSGLSEVFRRHVLLPITTRRDSMLLYAGRAVELDPELAEAATELGFAYLFSWNHSLAEEEFLRALRLDPNQADALSGMARLSAINGNIDEAVRWERKRISIDPFSTERLYNLGRYLLDLGDLQGARSSFERVVSLVPDHPEGSYLLAVTHLIRGDFELAEARMRTLEEIASDKPAVNLKLAKYNTHLGRFEAAENYLMRTPSAEFGAIGVLYAFIVQQLGQRERAAEILQQPAEMIELWEDVGFTVPPRGKLYIQLIQGEWDQAIETLQGNWRSGLHWLEDPPDPGIYWIDKHPVVEPLLKDPRFETLLAEIRQTFDAMREGLEQESQ